LDSNLREDKNMQIPIYEDKENGYRLRYTFFLTMNEDAIRCKMYSEETHKSRNFTLFTSDIVEIIKDLTARK
jgi:hypothetical protein